ncbi:MAG TPA: high-potential iron-sulfur protein [Steroidobacteraceae bacterium]|nr:high-potential iron-sulfur protein [Steroidobacteraceae bacterium]
MNRRDLLAKSLLFSIATGALQATAAQTELCVDPDDLSSADYQFRKYVKYTESSDTPGKACSGCTFFKPGQGNCGSCQIVGGSINANGYCTSWNARASNPAAK